MLQRIIVPEHHNGILFQNGRYQQTLEPGRYFRWMTRPKVQSVDMRRRLTTVPAQELLTSDGIGIKATAVVGWQINDARTAIIEVVDVTQAVYVAAQLALRDVLVSRTFDEVMANRAMFGEELLGAFQGLTSEMGVAVHQLELKDLMLPGDLKRIYSQVAEARQQGLADLERARSQTATLRSLANAAKLLRDNPELVRARVLDAMESASGNTFVVGADMLDISTARTSREG